MPIANASSVAGLGLSVKKLGGCAWNHHFVQNYPELSQTGEIFDYSPKSYAVAKDFYFGSENDFRDRTLPTIDSLVDSIASCIDSDLISGYRMDVLLSGYGTYVLNSEEL
jgi:hypothetical protein